MLRYENKYYIPEDKVPLLRSMLLPFVKHDPFADSMPDKRYTVRSIYFETPRFDCYWKKIAGLAFRDKLRLRGYNNVADEKNVVFFEIKRKKEIPLEKFRSQSVYEDAKKIFKGADPLPLVKPAHQENISKFMYNLHTRRMRPVVLVVYEREALMTKTPDSGNNLRITLDQNLRGMAYPTLDDLYENKKLNRAINGYSILEVKYNIRFPSWVMPILGTIKAKKESASKYCICIDAENGINPRSPVQTISYGKFFSDR